MNKKIFISTALMSILAISFISIANAQSNEQPLRQQPNIEEDQIIICVKDVEHKAYFGQLSCIISNDGLDNPVLKKLGKQAMSLKDTFEMGLID